jgi:hypothetical protein
MMTLSEDFKWVQERSECSLFTVFQLLRQQVTQDVTARQEMCKPIADREGRPVYAHSFDINEAGNSFTVTLVGHQLNERICFLLESDSIKVTNTEGTVILEATPSLNVEGKCIAKIGKLEYPLWYVRMMALERLFFGIVQN